MGTKRKHKFCTGMCFKSDKSRTISIEYILRQDSIKKDQYIISKNLCEDYSVCEFKDNCQIYLDAKVITTE